VAHHHHEARRLVPLSAGASLWIAGLVAGLAVYAAWLFASAGR